MNPGIFYLYEYNNTQKLRNVGFLKLTRYYHSCTLQLNARGIPVSYAETLKLYAFYLENDTVGATVLAEVPCMNHMFSARLNFAECKFPDGHTLNTMDGFFLPLSNGRILAAAVPGILVDTKKLLSIFKNPSDGNHPSPHTKSAPKVQETKSDHEKTALETQDTKTDHEKTAPETQEAKTDHEKAALETQDTKTDHEKAAPETQEASPNAEERLTDAQNAVPQAPDDDKTASSGHTAILFEEDSLPSIDDAKPEQADIVPGTNSDVPNGDTAAQDIDGPTNPACTDPIPDNGSTEPEQDAPQYNVRKIQRSDMSDLPRCHWHLANNSFLLHGYHNYSHLLLVEEDGHYWLGVPGVYEAREAKAARLFGFPQFTDSYNDHLELTEDEQNSQGQFGYWCCYLK